jgi:ribosomal protein S18 acetylase RimI-like enzyme
MEHQEEHQRLLEHALAQVELPIGICLRVWCEGDFPAIQRLSSAEGWPTPERRPDEALAAWKASWPALVALEADQVVGFVRALTDGAITLYVMELLVAPAQQRKGIGRLLLDTCHLLYPRTRLEVTSAEMAQSFYGAHGFRYIGPGLRKSYA